MIYSSLYRLIITTATRQTGEDNYVMVCNGLHNYHIDSGHLELDFTHEILPYPQLQKSCHSNDQNQLRRRLASALVQ